MAPSLLGGAQQLNFVPSGSSNSSPSLKNASPGLKNSSP